MIGYVLYDEESKEYLGRAGCRSMRWDGAQWYKRKKAAVARASLLNVERNVPPGMEPNKYYQNRPQVVVLEFRDRWLIARHPAPPVYYDVEIDPDTGAARRVPIEE